MIPKTSIPTPTFGDNNSTLGISRRAALRRAGGGGLVLAGVAILGNAPSAIAARQSADTGRAELLALADGIIAALNGDDPDALDAWVAPDAAGHVPLAKPGEGKDLKWVKDRVAIAGKAFPERTIVIKGIIVDGDQISAHGTFEGTHDGPLKELSATGGKVTVAWIAFVTVTDGKVSEYWYQIDALSALEQFGLFAIDGDPDGTGADY